MQKTSSIDTIELKKFEKTAKDWWDINGEFKLLHKINPLRVEYIISVINNHFNIISSKKSIENIKILDVGCGGGLISTSLAKKDAIVTGIDANESNVNAAKDHSEKFNLNAEYFHDTVENHIKSEKKYDVVICLEVIEHVANVEDFMLNLDKLVEDGGILIMSTINRTKKSYLLAIIMAEYVLNWVPRKTHDYSKFVQPSELSNMLENTQLSISELQGMSYSVLSNEWFLTDDIDVNYFAVFKKHKV